MIDIYMYVFRNPNIVLRSIFLLEFKSLFMSNTYNYYE